MGSHQGGLNPTSIINEWSNQIPQAIGNLYNFYVKCSCTDTICAANSLIMGMRLIKSGLQTAPSGFVRWNISHVSLVCAGCSNFTRKSQHGGEGKGSCSRRWFSLGQCNFFCSSCRRPLDREISLPRRMRVRICVFVPNVRTGLHGWVHLQEGNTCVKNSIWEDLDSSSLYHSVPGYVRDHLFVESKILKQKEQSFEPFSFLSNNILHFLCPGTFQ